MDNKPKDKNEVGNTTKMNVGRIKRDENSKTEVPTRRPPTDDEIRETKKKRNQLIGILAIAIALVLAISIVLPKMMHMEDTNTVTTPSTTLSVREQNIQKGTQKEIQNKQWKNSERKLKLNSEDKTFTYSYKQGESLINETGTYKVSTSTYDIQSKITIDELFDKICGETRNNDGSAFIGSKNRNDSVIDYFQDAQLAFDQSTITSVKLTIKDTKITNLDGSEMTTNKDLPDLSDEEQEDTPSSNTEDFLVLSYINNEGKNHIAIYDINKQSYTTYEIEE